MGVTDAAPGLLGWDPEATGIIFWEQAVENGELLSWEQVKERYDLPEGLAFSYAAVKVKAQMLKLKGGGAAISRPLF